MTILGTATKFRPGGLAVNFGRSAGVYCWDGCKLLGAGCYAERLEGYRGALARKLERMEQLHPTQICYAAAAELQVRLYEGWQVPWFRFAMAGAMPPPKAWGGDVKGLRLLCEILAANGLAPELTHMPIEEPSRAAWYRKQIGDLVTVRQSIQTTGVRAAGACSFVVGELGQPKTERLDEARDLAKRRTEATGRKCKVCPHIAWAVQHPKEKQNPKTKCGAGGCTSCADETVDIVYPLTS